MTGLPVRVVRGYPKKNNINHTKYLPEQGFRYDGLYKVCNVWTEEGQSKFKVWRYLLRRDDDEPAPWTKEGKKLIKKYGLEEMQLPESKDPPESQKKKKKHTSEEEESSEESQESLAIMAMIKKDNINSGLWKSILEKSNTKEVNRSKFLGAVLETFMCSICFDRVTEPQILTCSCKYIACKACLIRGHEACGGKCSICKSEFKVEDLKLNIPLWDVLTEIIPILKAQKNILHINDEDSTDTQDMDEKSEDESKSVSVSPITISDDEDFLPRENRAKRKRISTSSGEKTKKKKEQSKTRCYVNS